MKRHRRELTANHPAEVSARARRIVRTTLSAAALALAISPLGGVAIASADYRDSDFEACMNRNMPTDYCCEHAGGVMRNGACIDPATLRVAISGGVQQVPPTKAPPRVIAGAPTLTAAQ